MNTDFLVTCLTPWLEKWEAELEKKLLLPSEQGRFCIEFETDSLLRADIAARYTSYTQALTSGWLSVNEVRAKEGLEEVPGGDVYASVTSKTAAPRNTAGTHAGTRGTRYPGGRDRWTMPSAKRSKPRSIFTCGIMRFQPSQFALRLKKMVDACQPKPPAPPAPAPAKEGAK